MKLTYEYVAVVIANDGQGLITINYLSQLNEKSMEGICQLLRRPGGTTGIFSNHGVVVSAMDKDNLQGMIYYIKHFKRIGHMCTHTDVEISKFHAMYHHMEMEESHKYPEIVSTVGPRDWPKTLETVEEYIRAFHGVDI